MSNLLTDKDLQAGLEALYEKTPDADGAGCMEAALEGVLLGVPDIAILVLNEHEQLEQEMVIEAADWAAGVNPEDQSIFRADVEGTTLLVMTGDVDMVADILRRASEKEV